MALAPIALFVYNRPRHTQETIAALRRNLLAAESDLIVFCDGGKTDEDWQRVNEVRRFVKSVEGFKSVTVDESAFNLGLGRSIIDGITKVTAIHGRGIILEDDEILAPRFLDFMNAGLSLYENDPAVAAINGYLYPVKGTLPETFFLRGENVWGFGLWKRSWDIFEPDGAKLLRMLEERGLTSRFSLDNTAPFKAILEAQIRGENDSWAVRWQAAAFLRNMLTLFPNKSLVRNIGYDGTGRHCGVSSVYDTDIYEGEIKVERIELVECKRARKALVAWHREAFKSGRRHRLRRWVGGTRLGRVVRALRGR